MCSYEPDNTLCPLLTLKQYLRKTEPLRGTERALFISVIQPHKGVSRDTISRWTKSGLKSAGIDTSQFTAQSTKAASSSKAKERDVPLDVIPAITGWGSAATFQVLPQTNCPTTYFSRNSTSIIITFGLINNYNRLQRVKPHSTLKHLKPSDFKYLAIAVHVAVL